MTGHAAILTVDLGAIAANYARLRAEAAGAEVAGVVKADAYGLGVVEVAPCLWRAGARTFFVAHLSEGIGLRAVLSEARIGVLNGIAEDEVVPFREHRLTPVLNQLSEIDRWREAAGGSRQPAFIHIDTGMSRLGLDDGELAALAAQPGRLDGLDIQAYLSHLAVADEAENPLTAAQTARFADAVTALPAAALSLANSPGVFRAGVRPYDLVRPGSALYGVNPTPGRGNPMRQVVRLDAPILQVRTVPPGATVGYGATHAVTRESRIATLPVGYADGYMRCLSGTGTAMIGDHPAPIVGRVSMDLLTIDVTAIPEAALRPPAYATLIGPHRTVDDVAREAGTIGYEVLTGLGSRYKRIYLDGAVSSATAPRTTMHPWGS